MSGLGNGYIDHAGREGSPEPTPCYCLANGATRLCTVCPSYTADAAPAPGASPADGPTLTVDERTRADAIAERWAKATPGPWCHTRNGKWGVKIWGDTARSCETPLFQSIPPLSHCTVSPESPEPQWSHDVSAVAAAPSDVAFLLDLVRRLSSGQPGGAGTTEGDNDQ